MPNKPSGQEEEYFARLEFEKKKKAEAENHARMAEEEKRELKELHLSWRFISSILKEKFMVGT